MARGRFAEDLVGRTFGQLTVLERVENGPPPRSVAMWRCSCTCGASAIVMGHRLRTGRTQSCGCLARQCGNAHLRARGELQRERIMARLSSGAATREQLADLLRVHDGTISKHLGRLPVHEARMRGLSWYALTQEAADAAARAYVPPVARVPRVHHAAVVVPPARESETRVRLPVVAGFVRGEGDRHEGCGRYSGCLHAYKLASQARCPDGARDERLGCYVEHDHEDDLAAATVARPHPLAGVL